jgi:hypothetical protein
MIDEQETGSETTAAIAVRHRTSDRTRAAEPAAPAGEPAKTSGIADRRPAGASTARPESPADFPLRLTRAMHEVARAHRERVIHELELRRVAVLAAIRDQRRADARRARQLTAAGRIAVDRWAATAQRQIKTERQRKKVELDADLRRTLREQNRQVERRVQAIEARLAAYQADLEAFFEAIDRERDPEAIALQARRRPAFPDLTATDGSDARPT